MYVKEYTGWYWASSWCSYPPICDVGVCYSLGISIYMNCNVMCSDTLDPFEECSLFQQG